MRCEVLLFAQAADMLGRDRVAIDLAEGATVTAALDQLFREHDVLAPLRGRVAVAIDERYAAPSAPVPAGSTIALIPPVSGG